MRVLYKVVIVGMALALLSAPALAGGKGGGGSTTKGGNAQYLKYDFRNTVITTTKSGSTGPTKPPLPTAARVTSPTPAPPAPAPLPIPYPNNPVEPSSR